MVSRRMLAGREVQMSNGTANIYVESDR